MSETLLDRFLGAKPEPAAGSLTHREREVVQLIAEGRIQLDGAPGALIEKTRGRIWTKTIDREEVESYRERFEIISTRLFAGRTVIHILSDSDPGDGFASVQGGLEDVYFSTLALSRRAA